MPSLTDEYLALDGANRFLAEHCAKTLEEIGRQCRGISQSVNRCNADYADCWEAVEELRKQLDSQAKVQGEANAAIGRLQEQVAALEGSVQKARETYSELLNRVKQHGNGPPTHSSSAEPSKQPQPLVTKRVGQNGV